MTDRRALAGFIAVAVLAATAYATTGASSANIELSDICPAGFAPDDDGRCRLVTLYRDYPEHVAVRDNRHAKQEFNIHIAFFRKSGVCGHERGGTPQ